MASKKTTRKIINAAKTLQDLFDKTTSAEVAEPGSIIQLTDGYEVLKTSTSTLTFTLQFNTIGASALTTAKLHDNATGDALIINDAPDSIIKQAIGAEKLVAGKFLKIRSVVNATTLTPLPANLHIDFTIDGGKNGSVAYKIPPGIFKKAGDLFKIDILIFFFSL